ncbi:uncharacterized protein LOC115094495 isoform X2 [Rhinatrema bivittatum]|uniref:uncharacterized protein LOC115094495 isoform X2 n=1 Tax=Rhinatrema bivittatum TaxID=194408 RepID=UPI00112D019B|nr:uncharacterized protein LOC115094495 isoform X2 [Rhinatrema bivittatum]
MWNLLLAVFILILCIIWKKLEGSLRREEGSSGGPSARSEEGERSRAALPLRSQKPAPGQDHAVNPEVGDVPDAFHVPENSPSKTDLKNLQQALLTVFDCAYSQFILPWYEDLEPCRMQPMYQTLLKLFNATIDTIEEKMAHIKGTQLALIFICVLTCHLQQCKQNTSQAKEKIFQTRKQEVDFLRKYAKVITDHLLSMSLSESQYISFILNEILTLKVLEPVLNMLSDPDFINQMLVKWLQPETLGGQPAPVEEERPGAMPPVCTSDNECSDSEEDTVTKPAKTGAGRTKKTESDRKHSRRRGADSAYRNLSLGEDSEAGFRDQKEAEQCWTALLCILCQLESMKVKVVNLQDFPALEKIRLDLISEEPNKRTHPVDGECLQSAETILNDFLQELVTLIKTDENGEVCLFLSPLEESAEDWDAARNVWLLLSALLGGEDMVLAQSETEMADEAVRDESKPCSQMEACWEQTNSSEKCEFPAESTSVSVGPAPAGSDATHPLHLRSATIPSSSAIHRDDLQVSSSSLSSDGEDDKGARFRGLRNTKTASLGRRSRIRNENYEQGPEQSHGQEDVSKLLTEALKLLEEMLEESKRKFICGVLRSVLKVPCIKRKAEEYLSEKCNKYLSESQLASYVDILRNTLWPGGRPAVPGPERTAQEKAETKIKAEKLLSQVEIKKLIKPDPQLHSIFQEAENNRRLMYMSLYNLSEELIPGLQQSLDMPWVKSQD